MFDAWLEQEEQTAKEKCRTARILRILWMVIMLPMALMQVILMLDGMGGELYILSIVFWILLIVGSWFIFSLGSHKKLFMKPLLASVERELPTDAEKQEFVRQMQSAGAGIAYAPVPQGKACDMRVAADYCYYREMRKSRIIRNREIKRVLLAPSTYTVGRGHQRSCYVLKLFTAEDEKNPAWKAYFVREDELYDAFGKLQEGLPQEVVVQDDVAYGKTEEGEKEAKKKALFNLVMSVILVAIMIALIKLSRSAP
ncbi:MAG: hypothetical protein NC337_08550 [Roseburia sp.]|nr:hypothetical protein [Roseburia sp.]